MLNTMHEKASQSLVNYLERKAGQALRVVFHYNARSEEYELLYLREDIKRKYDRDDLEAHFDTFRRDAEVGRIQEGELDTGTHHCSIRVYDKSLIFNFTHHKRSNTIVSLDPTAGRDLLGFIAEALKALDVEASDGEYSTPKWVFN